jgi:wyosine [tRNA(Phe)-imidazoG37] synthetase (radical SAM superfamily)
VPGLAHGTAPEADLALLERELEGFLRAALDPAWQATHLPEDARALRDVAFSGDGESTSCPNFAAAVETVGRVFERLALTGKVRLVLITNGSLLHRDGPQQGLRALARIGGEAWCKLDSATAEGQARLNGAHAGVERARANLVTCARLCPTWIQTMALALDGEPPSAREQAAYLDLVRGLVAEAVPLRGVLLYGYARPSHQPEAPRLAALPRAWLEDFARRIEAAGLPVRVHA